MRRAFCLIALLAFIAGSVLPVFGEPQRRRTPRRRTPVRTPVVQLYTVPANTVLRVRMDSQLNSKTARVGDRFTTTVTEPGYAGGVEVIPVGSKILGRVSSVQRAGRRTPGSTGGSS